MSINETVNRSAELRLRPVVLASRTAVPGPRPGPDRAWLRPVESLMFVPFDQTSPPEYHPH